MADSIQMRVTRYTPGEDAAPRVAGKENIKIRL